MNKEASPVHVAPPLKVHPDYMLLSPYSFELVKGKIDIDRLLKTYEANNRRFPKDLSGGWLELEDGEKLKGRAMEDARNLAPPPIPVARPATPNTRETPVAALKKLAEKKDPSYIGGRGMKRKEIDHLPPVGDYNMRKRTLTAETPTRIADHNHTELGDVQWKQVLFPKDPPKTRHTLIAEALVQTLENNPESRHSIALDLLGWAQKILHMDHSQSSDDES
jgi:hypothetical protein